MISMGFEPKYLRDKPATKITNDSAVSSLFKLPTVEENHCLLLHIQTTGAQMEELHFPEDRWLATFSINSRKLNSPWQLSL